MASVLKADIIPFWFDLVCFDSPVEAVKNPVSMESKTF